MWLDACQISDASWQVLVDVKHATGSRHLDWILGRHPFARFRVWACFRLRLVLAFVRGSFSVTEILEETGIVFQIADDLHNQLCHELILCMLGCLQRTGV